MKKIGLVIPTVLSRPDLLPLVYNSCTSQGDFVEVIVGCPENLIPSVRSVLPRGAKVVAEKRNAPLAEIISELMLGTSPDCKYIGWIGDDDVILPGAMQACLEEMEKSPEAVMVFGACDYIDETGQILFNNKSGAWAAKLLRFGPQLIPQPGSVMRRDAFEKVGGLNPNLNLAFDFDIFLKLKALGELRYIPKTLAQFRWHPGSLSVRKRWPSVSEASKVRRSAYGFPMNFVGLAWEPIVMFATWLAGKILSWKVRRAYRK